MGDNQGIFQHFKAEERAFADYLLDKIDRVGRQYHFELTDFLNPREAFIAESLARRAGLQVFSSQQICPTETCRLILAPDYYQLSEDDFELALLSINYARKFNQLTHAQILGNLLNQLGIKRQLLGDILLTDETTQIVIDRQISQLVIQMVTHISRVPVKWQSLALSELRQAEVRVSEMELLATSWRLDHLLALAHRMTRTVALKWIESGKVKVNHQLVERPSHLLQVDDMISCRGYGRFEISAYRGQTKNGKLKLSIRKIGGK